jgi:hypothetical protein
VSGPALKSRTKEDALSGQGGGGKGWMLFRIVMKPTFCNLDFTFVEFINQSMFLVYS